MFNTVVTFGVIGFSFGVSRISFGVPIVSVFKCRFQMQNYYILKRCCPLLSALGLIRHDNAQFVRQKGDDSGW